MTTFVQAADAAFLPAGLALYRSLLRHMTGDWRMVWVVLDPDGMVRLRNWATAQAEAADRLWLVSWTDVADDMPGLHDALRTRLDADEKRTGPWYWTWAAQVTHWMIERAPQETVIFLDSDCYAFADLTPALAEVEAAGADVGMMDHRFPPHRAERATRGGWWAGFNVFRPTLRSRAAAAVWAALVRERCLVEDPGDEYLGIPPGLAGDQAGLHALERIARVHKIQRPGFVASWNADGAPVRPWLWHAHEYRYDAHGRRTRTTGYPIPDCVATEIVAPYELAVLAAATELTP